MGETKHSLETILQAIRGTGAWEKDGKMTSSGGNKSIVAKRLHVSRSTVHLYIKRWVSVKEAFEDEKEAMLDFTEHQGHALIADKNVAMIIFYLKTQGKERGYVERVENTGRDGDAIQVKHEFADDARERLAVLLGADVATGEEAPGDSET